ncbi:MAG: WecB/TagA/CpsF family glycosyltransferase, partial [Gemmatimonadales bacterium]
MQAPNIARIDVEPVWIGTIPVHPVRLSDTLAFIDRVATSNVGEKAVIHYANAHAVNLAGRNGSFRDAMIGASLVFCDGKSLQWAARVLGGQLPERFTPPDWIDDLCAQAAARRHRLFFLGGADGVAEAAADQLRSRHAGLEVSTAHGYFDRTPAAVSEVIRTINENRTDILLVGL